MYSAYYRTPRLYLSGYLPNGSPLPPTAMMDDIVGDYKDKTVTLEDFPFFANNIKMASVHPCKHASVMRTLLDRADAALRIRREKMRQGKAVGGDQGMEGLVDELDKMEVSDAAKSGAVKDAKEAESAKEGDEWEEVEQSEIDEQEVAIRVDQYLVVFLKVCSSFPSLFRFFFGCLMTFTDIHVCSSWPASHRVSSMTSPWAYKGSAALQITLFSLWLAVLSLGFLISLPFLF